MKNKKCKKHEYHYITLNVVDPKPKRRRVNVVIRTCGKCAGVHGKENGLDWFELEMRCEKNDIVLVR